MRELHSALLYEDVLSVVGEPVDLISICYSQLSNTKCLILSQQKGQVKFENDPNLCTDEKKYRYRHKHRDSI